MTTSSHRLARVALLLALTLVSSARAQTVVTWADTGTDFGAGASWVGGVPPADNPAVDEVRFSTANPTFQPVISVSQSVHALTFTAGAGPFTLSGTGTLTLATGFTLLNSAANTTISAPLAVSGSTRFHNDGGLTLSGPITSTGTELALTGGTGSTALVSGVISGGIDVRLQGGTWTLTGANTYSGYTQMWFGTLVLGADAPLGNSSGLYLADATLRTTATFTMSSARALDFSLSPSTITQDASTTLTYGGNLTGNAALTKSGAGTLILSGNNAFSGAITVADGTLQIGASGTSGSVASTSIVNNAALVFDRSDAVTYGGVISGSGILTKAGGGTLTLSGTNTYSGGTIVSAGTLQIGDSTTNGAIAGDVALASATTLAFNRSDAVTFPGAISGSGGVVQSGGGTLTLSGTNTYTGGTTLNAGTLSLASDASLGHASGGIAFGGGTLLATSTLTSARPIALNTGGGTIDDGGYTLTLSGNLTGTGALTKIGAGTLTLSGTNTHSGGTTVSAGTLAGTAASLQGAIVNNAAVTFDQTSAGTYSGVMSGFGSLTKSGGGTLTLSGANTYSGGTTITAGTLVGDTTSLNGAIANSGVLTFNQASAGTFSGAISGTGSVTKTGAGTLTLNHPFNNYSGGTIVAGGNLAGGAYGSGTVTLADANVGVFIPANAITSPITVSAGTGTATIGRTASGNALYTGAISLNRPTTLYDGSTGGGTLGFNGVISGNVGTLTIDGPHVTLSATNTFSGNIAITAGSTLEAGGSFGVQPIPAGTGVDIGTGGSLLFGSDLALGALSGGSGTTVQVLPTGTGSVGLTIGSSNTDTTFAGVIANSNPSGLAVRLIKVGTGTLTLTGSNTFTGNTTVSAGTLELGGPIYAGASPAFATITVENGATLAFGTSLAISPASQTQLRINSGGLVTSGNNFNAIGSLTLNGGELRATGGLGTSGGVVYPAFQLGGFVSTGFGTSSSITSTGAANSGIMIGHGFPPMFGSTDGVVFSLSQSSLTISAPLQDSRNYANPAVAEPSALTVSGFNSTVTLSGANTYTGGTNVYSVTLLLGGNDRLAAAGPLTLGGGTFATGGFSQTLGALTLSGGGTIDFGSGTSALAFAYTAATTWSGTLSILNFTSAQDSLRFGTDGTALTPAQLAAINFGSGLTAQIDGNGFVIGVSAIPEPSTYAALLGLVALGVAIRRRRARRR